MLASANGSKVYHDDWRGLLPRVPTCQALIVDAPYSAKCHDGHDGAVAHGSLTEKMAPRRSINYQAWDTADVRTFVEAWHPVVTGWMVSITDDQLAPAWTAAFEAVGRYAFAWLPFVAPGSRVRLSGDGPSSWTTWIVVARPRTREMSRWGTLPGAYVLPPGHGGSMPVVGGKPIWLGCELVKHYSRPGDTVVDPCCGAGTFGVAAIREGRKAIVGDAMLAHAQLAAQWIANPWRAAPGMKDEGTEAQPSLFGGVQ